MTITKKKRNVRDANPTVNSINDEDRMTELVIMTDGRVFTFGTSLPVLEILNALEPANAQVNHLLARVRCKKGESE